MFAEAQAAPDIASAGAEVAPADEPEADTAGAAGSAAETASELSSLDALSSMGLDDEAADGGLVLPAGEGCL